MDFPKLVDVTLVADAGNIYASGETLVIPQLISGALFDKNRAAVLDAITVIDEDDQGVAFDLYFFDAAVSLGTINTTAAPSDAAMRSFLAVVPIATGDYKDLGGVRVAHKPNLGLIIKPVVDTADIYVGAVNGAGTPTFTASGLKLRLGFRRL